MKKNTDISAWLAKGNVITYGNPRVAKGVEPSKMKVRGIISETTRSTTQVRTAVKALGIKRAK